MIAFLNRASAWLLVALASVIILFALRDPIPQSYANYDEIAYNSLAISLLKNGTYRLDAQPDGIVPTDTRFAANPQLYPYLSYLSFKLFGVSRAAMRIPASLAFLGCALVLGFLAVRQGLQPLHVISVLLLLLSCPFLLYSARIARPETLSALGVYVSCALCVRSQTQTGAWRRLHLLGGGATAALAGWNHPMFAGCAILPLFFIHPRHGSTPAASTLRSIGWWTLGGTLCVMALAAVLVLPYWDAWKEQFPLNSSTVIEAGRHPDSDRLNFSPFKLLADLRARFSTFGNPYLLWYLAAPLVYFVLLRPTRRFALALGVSVVWLLISTHVTITVVTYIIQFTAAVPLLALLCKPRESGPGSSDRSVALLSGVAALLVGAHAAMVFMPTYESRAFADREGELTRTIANLPGTGPIAGPVEAAMPAWKSGRRYFMPSPPFFDTQPGVRERYHELVRTQAEWFIQPDGTASRTPP